MTSSRAPKAASRHLQEQVCASIRRQRQATALQNLCHAPGDGSPRDALRARDLRLAFAMPEVPEDHFPLPLGQRVDEPANGCGCLLDGQRVLERSERSFNVPGSDIAASSEITGASGEW